MKLVTSSCWSVLITLLAITEAFSPAHSVTKAISSDLRGGARIGGLKGHEKQQTQSSKLQQAANPIVTDSKCPATGFAAVCSTLYGTLGVLYILAKAIKRVVPIAMEPFAAKSVPLTKVQLGAYVLTVLWFSYVEGYKGFQKKFSPLVVKRSFTLIPGKNGTRWYHFLLAPLYSMGMIHATKKRKIVSWSVTMGVAGIVAAVKRLPYPYRNIVDAGVVAGLTWGSLSTLYFYVRSWMTGVPPEQVGAELPE